MHVAEQQHTLAVAWRAAGRRPASVDVCERFGISKQTWSRITTGERWAGNTGFAALNWAASTEPRTTRTLVLDTRRRS